MDPWEKKIKKRKLFAPKENREKTLVLIGPTLIATVSMHISFPLSGRFYSPSNLTAQKKTDFYFSAPNKGSLIEPILLAL